MPLEPGRQPTSLLNVTRFVLARPKSVRVLAEKLLKRVKERPSEETVADNARWMDATTLASSAIAQRIDSDLWDEALAFGERLRERAAKILPQVPFDTGGGGNYEFLYWMTRYFRPTYVVETGVSAGWSSEAFLTAMAENNHGELCSSDFPYFRVKDPERYIGVLVSEPLKGRWRLSTDGDKSALPRIVASLPQVDLFHYDSDKSYSGRSFAVSVVRPKLSENGFILVDDISDNSWFHDFIRSTDWDHAVLDGRCGFLDPSHRLFGLAR